MVEPGRGCACRAGKNEIELSVGKNLFRPYPLISDYRASQRKNQKEKLVEFNKVMDSGERQNFETGAVRDTSSGKGRYDLLPVNAIRRVARHYENGARKYEDRNWEKGIPITRYIDSALRHLFSALDRRVEEDHLAAAAWNVLCAIETMEWVEKGVLPETLDDVPRRSPCGQNRGAGMAAFLTFDDACCDCGEKT